MNVYVVNVYGDDTQTSVFRSKEGAQKYFDGIVELYGGEANKDRDLYYLFNNLYAELRELELKD